MKAILFVTFMINSLVVPSSGAIDTAEQKNAAIEQKLKSLKSMKDILEKFELGEGIQANERNGGYIFTEQGVGRHSDHRIKVDVARQAPCKPRRILQETRSLISGGYVVWPNCIAYKQCGGCCTDRTRKCSPVRHEEKKEHLMVINHADNKLIFKPFTYYEHKECSCSECKIKEHHCVGNEVYRPDQCMCECPIQYRQCDSGKQWSTIDCACTCMNQHQIACNPGYQVWNKDTCSCDFKTWTSGR